jgi:malonyl-CoA O-methyltransferase
MSKTAALQQTIAERILQRLDFIRLAPQSILDVSLVESGLQAGLQEKYPDADIQQAAPSAINQPDKSVDLVVMNLTLLEDMSNCLQEVMRVLKPDSIFIFTQLGVESLKEIRNQQVQFPDMHDIGDALLKHGFQDPVMDMQNIIFTYTAKEKVIPDMQGTGYEPLLSSYQAEAQADGLYPLTLEIIYGLAYKPAKALQHSHENEVRISIDEITRKR